MIEAQTLEGGGVTRRTIAVLAWLRIELLRRWVCTECRHAENGCYKRSSREPQGGGQRAEALLSLCFLLQRHSIQRLLWLSVQVPSSSTGQ